MLSGAKSILNPFLAKKRDDEKKQNRYSRPYTHYLNEVEKIIFNTFWNAYKSLFLYTFLTGRIPISLEEHPHLSPYFICLVKDNLHLNKNLEFFSNRFEIKKKLEDFSVNMGISYLKTFRSFDELLSNLQGKYNPFHHNGKQIEKHLASAFYPIHGYGFFRSQTFQQTSAQGSVFKLVTAYQALMEQYKRGENLNSFTIIDDLKGSTASNSRTQILGYQLNGTPLYRFYKGGKLPRTSHRGVGKIDILGALEQSSNLYFALLAGDKIEKPADLIKAAQLFGLGEKTGVDLPYEVKGNLPNDLDQNKTGLYAFSIGQHTLEVTPLQTAVMLGAIGNQKAGKGRVVSPHVLKEKGKIKITPKDHFFPFSDEVFQLLAEGMRRTVSGPRGSARPTTIKAPHDHPLAHHEYRLVCPSLLAKTGTAQFRYKQIVAKNFEAYTKCNAWFASIAYPEELAVAPPQNPELIVVVFLRFRDAGSEGGAIAAQIINKWREIKKRSRAEEL